LASKFSPKIGFKSLAVILARARLQLRASTTDKSNLDKWGYFINVFESPPPHGGGKFYGELLY
jgi:hypothetical protein